MRAKNNALESSDQRWLSIKQFAELFGLSISTQQTMRKTRGLPYSKIGKTVRYDRFKVDAYFEECGVSA